MRLLIAAILTLVAFSTGCAAQNLTPGEPGGPIIVPAPTSDIAGNRTRSSTNAPDVAFTAPAKLITGCADRTIALDVTSQTGIARVDIIVQSFAAPQRYVLTAPPWTVNWVMPCDASLPGGTPYHNYRLRAVAIDANGEWTVLVRWVFSQ